MMAKFELIKPKPKKESVQLWKSPGISRKKRFSIFESCLFESIKNKNLKNNFTQLRELPEI